MSRHGNIWRQMAWFAGLFAFLISDVIAQQQSMGPAPTPPVRQSAPPPSITIAQLEQLAQGHNPTLAQAARQVEALQGRQVQVGLYPNPIAGYISEEIGEGGQAGQHGMFVVQEVVTGGKLELNRAVVAREIEQAVLDLRMQQQRVLNDIRAGAYEVLVAQQTVQIAEELVRIGAAAENAAVKLFEAREVSQVDVLQARVEANTAKIELAAAQRMYVAAWRRLAMLVGIPDLQPAPLLDRIDGNLPELSWNEATAALLSQSPQVARARAGVERARSAVARACAGRIPNFEMGAAVRYNDESNNTTVSLQVGVPLMIYDRNQGNIMQAQAELAAAEREVERIQLALRYRLAEVYREYDVARNQIAQYQNDILPYAKQSLELTRIGYEQGEFGYLELLTAQRTYSRTNLAYIEQLRDLWLAAVRIDGMLLTGGLESPAQDFASASGSGE